MGDADFCKIAHLNFKAPCRLSAASIPNVGMFYAMLAYVLVSHMHANELEPASGY